MPIVYRIGHSLWIMERLVKWGYTYMSLKGKLDDLGDPEDRELIAIIKAAEACLERHRTPESE